MHFNFHTNCSLQGGQIKSKGGFADLNSAASIKIKNLILNPIYNHREGISVNIYFKSSDS